MELEGKFCKSTQKKKKTDKQTNGESKPASLNLPQTTTNFNFRLAFSWRFDSPFFRLIMSSPIFGRVRYLLIFIGCRR